MHFSIIKIVIIGGLAMDELVMNEDFTVNEFLDQMLDTKNKLGRDVVGNIYGISVSTEGCNNRLQLQNKVASAMDRYINSVRNVHPTKRQLDIQTLILDESVTPVAEWDNPEDVLAWINDASDKLNDPEFATTVYKDGKTTAETMVDMLKSHGYGQVSGNLSETERKINAKMSDLENHGFLMTDFFNGEVPTQQQQVSNDQSAQTEQVQPQSSIDSFQSITNTPDNFSHSSSMSSQDLFADDEFDEANFLSNFDIGTDADDYEDDYKDKEEEETSFENLESQISEEDLARERDDISEELSHSQEKLENEGTKEKTSLANSFMEYQTPESYAKKVKRKEFFKKKDKNSQTQISEDLFTYNGYPKGENQSDFFSKNGKSVQTETQQTMDGEGFFTYKGNQKEKSPSDFFSKKEKSVQTKTQQTMDGEGFFAYKGDQKTASSSDFFSKKNKSLDADNQTNITHPEFNVPSDDIQENLAAISWAISTRRAEDIAQAEIALNALPESQITEYYRDQINFIKASLERENNLSEQQTAENSLEAFQEKYGPTANAKEMEIVNRIENELETLKERKQEIKEELLDIQSKIKEKKVTRIDAPVNIANKRNSDLAIAEVKEKVRLSTSVMRNNAAMEPFYKVVETHRIIDIVRASNAAKSLGENHTFTNVLARALNEISNTYYGKTPEELQEVLVESTKQLNEAQQLLATNPNENVYNNQLESVKAAFNQIITDRSKEKIFAAILEVQALGEDHPYSKTLTKTLDQIANIYHGKTVSQIKNQIIGCSKACNEAHEKIAVKLRELQMEDNGKNELMVQELPNEEKVFLAYPGGDFGDLMKAEKAFNQAITMHSKENIIVAANLTAKLDPKLPSTIALNNALNRLAVTHLDIPLNELRWQDMRNAVENAKKNSASINNKEVVEKFNQAVQTHTKADIIVALNMAKGIENGYELVGALNKMARSYYGVDAETLTQQFRNYSTALNKVKDMTAPDNLEIPADAKDNDAMPSFYKAVQTKDEADIMEAIQNANRLPDYHPMKKPLLDALNAQLLLVSKYEPVIEEIEEEVQENLEEKEELKNRATSLIEEYKDVNNNITKRENSLNQFAENKEKEKAELERKKKEELEPPARVVDDTTNKNPNLFKKAISGVKQALKQMSLKKIAKVVVIVAGICYVPWLMAGGYATKKLIIDPIKKKNEKTEEKEQEDKKTEKPKKVKKAKKVKKRKRPVYEDGYVDIDYENGDYYEDYYDDYYNGEPVFEEEEQVEDYYDEEEEFGNDQVFEESPIDESRQESDEMKQKMNEIIQRNTEKLNQARSEDYQEEENMEDADEIAQSIMKAEEQARNNRSQENVQFYKGSLEEGQWERLNSQEEIIKAMVDDDKIGYTTGSGETQSPVRKITNEEVINYLHTGELQTADEIQQILNEAEDSAEESLGRGK